MILAIIGLAFGIACSMSLSSVWGQICKIEDRLSKIEDRLNMKETDHLLELDSLEDSDEDYFKDGA